MKTTFRSFSFVALALAALAINPAVHAAAFTNGSFETNGGGGTTAVPWTFTLNGGVVLISNSFGSTDGTFAAVFGAGEFPAGATLSQTFDTIIGQTNTVTLDYGALGGGPAQVLGITVRDGIGNDLITSGSGSVLNGIGGNNSNVTLALNGNVLQLQDGSGAPPTTGAAPNLQFSTLSFYFVPTTTSSTITFTDLSPGTSSTDGVLDNVQIVPEPASAALLCLGTVGLLARRRRNNATV